MNVGARLSDQNHGSKRDPPGVGLTSCWDQAASSASLGCPHFTIVPGRNAIKGPIPQDQRNRIRQEATPPRCWSSIHGTGRFRLEAPGPGPPELQSSRLLLPQASGIIVSPPAGSLNLFLGRDVISPALTL